ncbi:DUF5686 and carboxypeptidase regulatory-like domain-containing protein [Mucilaginibacter myungsuensis]|uniref:Carboxypeptidase-like regulatory domain-containing protein n=1 Tax=Mucilaginibacter myungsuensis TaxID=649104 RepID=A0A929KUE5_9SPHI|nr:DUF5686 and carboxypeptidase regulatory-like domain-containing protein [Mucilaginibacter myungsuensis]MBE9661766.1 carboxypeptidase-like regulatory domain-containing protein [Mucilaginibacter myungsuensis]MDN3599800.1 DUF5686 and carboxypeptidase regulatory-like domain-containing protein [Mucilaginibacter myungsuensis]
MRTILLSFFAVLFTTFSFAQQSGVSGVITDETGHTVPFVSVHVKGTTRGTSANSEGKYTLQVPAGNHELLYKAIGYKQVSKTVTVKGAETMNVQLSAETYELRNVTVRAGGEDPAYAIIRKAIKNRKKYLNEVDSYTAEVYTKGLQKLLQTPKTFLGRDLDEMAKRNGLDSNRSGIVYLSESESKYSFKRPNEEHEEMISSKVSGSNQGFSFNRASDLKVNFYENRLDWEGLSNRPFISPIADNALFYYNYKYIGFTTENGETINKIKVIPKRDHDPAFDGYIYIMEDSWRIHSVDLVMAKRSNIFLLDSLKIKQQFLPVDKVWMPSSVKFEFGGGLLGFKFAGYFIGIFRNYEVQPTFAKNSFREVMRITKGVNKKDSSYWEASRPIPLTDEEITDYKKKEVLAAKRESKEYRDSLDAKRNHFTVGKLITGNGYNYYNRNTKTYMHFNSIGKSLLYNTVEGFVVDYAANFSKQIDTATNRYFNFGGKVRYGFANQLWHGSAWTSISHRDLSISLSGGSDVLDMNNRTSLTTWWNTVHSLLFRENYQKLYDKQFTNFGIGTRLAGTWTGGLSVEYSNRKWLPNTASFSLFKPKGNEFTSNNPFVPNAEVPLFAQNQAFKVGLRTSYDFSNKYATYPNGRRYLPSKYPRIDVSFTHAFDNVFGSDVSYSLAQADITKSDIKMGMFGKSSFYVGAGKFFGVKNITYVDYRHFSGNQIVPFDGGINQFALLNYYTYSTSSEYLEGHFEQNFSGFFLNKLPLIRQLKLQEILKVNYLSTPALRNYTELGFGVQYLAFRVMYAKSFNGALNAPHGIRIGIDL